MTEELRDTTLTDLCEEGWLPAGAIERSKVETIESGDDLVLLFGIIPTPTGTRHRKMSLVICREEARELTISLERALEKR